MKAILLGLWSSLFFAVTFVLNRMMKLSGDSWMWSASLRFLIMVPPLVLIVYMRGNLSPLLKELKQRAVPWSLWSTMGFGLFYAPLCLAANFGPAWLIAGTWQVTIVAGALLSPLFNQAMPVRALLTSIPILIGVIVMQFEQASQLTMREVLWGALPVAFAAFTYPLGNRKMMQLVDGRFDVWQRTLGMTLMSLPFWIGLSLYAYLTTGLPSHSQLIQTTVVAICSGIIATVLFFSATDMARHDPQLLASVEATQAGELVFAVLGGWLLLGESFNTIWSITGILLVVGGMVFHSLASTRA